jgi:hypothetical protein
VVWKEERNYSLNNTVRELHDDDGLETGGPEPGLIGSRMESVRVQRSFGASSGPAACTGFSVRGWGASAVGSWLSARVDGDPEDAWWWGGDVCVDKGGVERVTGWAQGLGVGYPLALGLCNRRAWPCLEFLSVFVFTFFRMI